MVNAFVLHSCPFVSARLHSDKHVHKMPIEGVQLISTALRHLLGNDTCDNAGLHKSVRSKAHPCVLWTRSSQTSLAWMTLHTLALHDEYKLRYGHALKSHDTARAAARLVLQILNDPSICCEYLPRYTIVRRMHELFMEASASYSPKKRAEYMRKYKYKLRPWPLSSDLNGVGVVAFGEGDFPDLLSHETSSLDLVESYRKYYACKLLQGWSSKINGCEVRRPYAFGGEFLRPAAFDYDLAASVLGNTPCVVRRAGDPTANSSNLVSRLADDHPARIGSAPGMQVSLCMLSQRIAHVLDLA